MPSEDDDPEEEESEVVEDCCSRLCRLVAAVFAVAVSPESTPFSSLATVEAKFEVELVESASFEKCADANRPEPRLRKSIAAL